VPPDGDHDIDGQVTQPGGLDLRDHPRPTDEGDRVSGVLGGAGNGDEWIEVTAAASKGEQDAHRTTTHDTIRTIKPIW
jgi:hypothetical protein